MTVPKCKVCERSGPGVEFPLFLLPPGFTFGEICAPCAEEKEGKE